VCAALSLCALSEGQDSVDAQDFWASPSTIVLGEAQDDVHGEHNDMYDDDEHYSINDDDDAMNQQPAEGPEQIPGARKEETKTEIGALRKLIDEKRADLGKVVECKNVQECTAEDRKKSCFQKMDLLMLVEILNQKSPTRTRVRRERLTGKETESARRSKNMSFRSSRRRNRQTSLKPKPRSGRSPLWTRIRQPNLQKKTFSVSSRETRCSSVVSR
jgi:hypothetical protein